MKKLFLIFLTSIFLITSPNLVIAHQPSTAHKMVHSMKRLLGASMLIVGVPALLSGILSLLQDKPDASVKAFYDLGNYLSFGIGIPSTFFGLLLLIPDPQTSNAEHQCSPELSALLDQFVKDTNTQL